MLSKLGPGRHVSKKIKTTDELEEEKDALRALDEANEREREKARQQRTLLQEAQEVKRQKELEGESAASDLGS
jgi:ATP-dependent RNA helicase DDX41